MRRTWSSTWSMGYVAAALVCVQGVSGARAQDHAPPERASAAVHTPPEEAVGTLRNARVARAVHKDAKGNPDEPLTFLAEELSDEQVAELGKLAPNVKIVRGLDRQGAVARAAEADGVDSRLCSPEFVAKAGKLAWIHSPSAGVERLVSMDGIRGKASLVVTNAKGVHGPAIADHAIGMLLTLTRQLVHYEHAQEKGEWDRGDPPSRPVVLAGRTMLVVGIGGIGTEIAQRAHGFGMRVIATRRSDAPAPDYVERVGKPEELKSMLPEADVIAVCVPLTKETEHLFDAGMFGAVKKGAYLINIARGKVIDTDAMIAALKDGRLAGAGLDVTDPEPLPQGHALWSVPNVVITPHVAAEGELTEHRWWSLFKENVRRFGAGEPLMNCVDVEAGY